MVCYVAIRNGLKNWSQEMVSKMVSKSGLKKLSRGSQAMASKSGLNKWSQKMVSKHCLKDKSQEMVSTDGLKNGLKEWSQEIVSKDGLKK